MPDWKRCEAFRERFHDYIRQPHIRPAELFMVVHSTAVSLRQEGDALASMLGIIAFAWMALRTICTAPWQPLPAPPEEEK